MEQHAPSPTEGVRTGDTVEIDGGYQRRARSPWPLIEGTMDLLGLAPDLDSEQHVSRPTPRLLRDLADASGFEIVQHGRFAGAAPFASVVSWRLAEALDRAEHRLGSLLYALWRKP